MLGPADLVVCAVPLAHVPLLDRLAPVRAAGFAGISIGVQDYLALREGGMADAEIRARIADAGLEVADIECVGNWLPGHDRAPSPYAPVLADMTPERGVDVAAALGARGLLVVEMLGVTAEPDVAAQAFGRICDLAAPAGIVVHLEGVAFGAIPTFAAARQVVERAGRANGALTLDPWHFFRGGGTLPELADLPPGLIGCFQFCDAPLVPQGEPLKETTTARLLPGEGELDLVGLVRAVDAIGAAVPVSVEVFHRRQWRQDIGIIARDWAEAARPVLARARGQE